MGIDGEASSILTLVQADLTIYAIPLPKANMFESACLNFQFFSKSAREKYYISLM